MIIDCKFFQHPARCAPRRYCCYCFFTRWTIKADRAREPQKQSIFITIGHHKELLIEAPVAAAGGSHFGQLAGYRPVTGRLINRLLVGWYVAAPARMKKKPNVKKFNLHVRLLLSCRHGVFTESRKSPHGHVGRSERRTLGQPGTLLGFCDFRGRDEV